MKVIYNETSGHSLLSEFKFKEFGIVINSICRRHGGAQQMIKKDRNDSDVLTVPLDLAGCMIHFNTDYLLLKRLLLLNSIASPKQYCLMQGGTPWNPSSFSDQMAETFSQHVIDTENYNILFGSIAKILTR